MKKKNITGLIITIAVFAVVLILSIYFFSDREPVYLQGQVEAKQINVAPKVPGRGKAIYKQEGYHKPKQRVWQRKPSLTKPKAERVLSRYEGRTTYGNKQKQLPSWLRKPINA